jgi:hypothetical protein
MFYEKVGGKNKSLLEYGNYSPEEKHQNMHGILKSIDD